MTAYRLYLTSGSTFDGDDERDSDDMVAAVNDPAEADWPAGWTWLAGLHVRQDAVIAIEFLPPTDHPFPERTTP